MSLGRLLTRPAARAAGLLLLAASTAGAALLQGEVLDERGLPLEGVHVQVVGWRAGAATDARGRFTLKLPDDETRRLRVTHLGYASLELDAAAGAPLALRLAPSLLEGRPVTVTATRAGEGTLPVTHTNLGRADLELAHHGQDLSRLLDGTPSLTTMSYSGTAIGYNEIRLRGFDQKRIEVLVNGVPINDPEDHYVYWVDLPDLGRSLRDAQIQRGTGTGLFGGSNFGGSINLLTDLADEPGLRLETARGSFDTWRHSLGWSSGLVDGTWQMEARWSQVATAGWRDATAVETWGAFFSARRFLPGGALRLTHYTGHELTHTAWDGVDLATLRGLHGRARDRTQNNDAAYANSIDDFRQPHSEAQLLFTLPDGSELDATLYHVDGSGFYETYKTGRDPGDYGLPVPDEGVVDVVNRRWIDKRQSGLTAVNRRAAWGGTLTLGLNGYTYDAEHFGRVIWASPLPAGQSPQGRYYTHQSAKEKAGLVAGLVLPVGSDLSLSASLSAQHTRYALRQRADGAFQGSLLNRFEDTRFFVNPALGLGWQLSEGLRLSAGLSAAAREPSRNEYWNAWEGPDDLGRRPLFARADTMADGSLRWHDPLVKPERMLDVEVGGEWRGRRHQLALNFYWLEMRDEIVAYGGMDEESPVRGNAPRSHHAGLELEGRLRPGRALESGGNLTLSRGRIDELVLHETRYGADWSSEVVRRDMAGNPAALSPAILANAWLEWRPLAGLVLRPRLQHVGRQYLDTSGDDEFSALHPDLIDPRYLDGAGRLRHSKTLPSRTTMGLDARFALAPWTGLDLALTLQVENLLDRDHETAGYWNDWVDSNGDGLYEPQPCLYPAAGRNWLLGVRLGI
ncbi:MAG: TonB-dependent receptor [bacterium]|jgi:iron complex outermembrane receptor protein|nr:TonB-dependent receptor [bacterium]